MARDIEEFLRRAAERRKQNQGQAAPPPAPPVAAPEEVAQRPKQRLANESNASAQPEQLDPYREIPRSREAGQKKAAPPKAPPVASPSKRQSKYDNKRESIADHVRDSIVVSDVTENAMHLGQEVGLADEKLEARLSKFDHAIGDLEGMSSIQDDLNENEGTGKSQLANELLSMFKQPQTIRQSILISEILKRPNFDD